MKNLYPLLILFLFAFPVLAQPDINVKQGSTSYPDGGGVPSPYSFGSVAVLNSSSAITFTIENTGTSGGPLTITSILPSGTNASDFTIGGLGTNSIGSSSSTTFTITFTPTASGVRTATVTINNDDPDGESIYTFTITGNGGVELYAKGLVTVEAGAILYVEGSAEIPTGGTIDNDGLIEIKKGNWKCDGTHSGTGEVEFTGSPTNDLQHIAGSNVTFYDVDLKLAKFNAGINLAQMVVHDSVEISGTMVLTDGKFIPDANKEIYVSNAATNAIQDSLGNSTKSGLFGLSESRYVEGKLRREVTDPNKYLWPVGSATNKYMPVDLDIVTKPGSANNIMIFFKDESDMGIVSNGAHNLDCSTFFPANAYNILSNRQELTVDEMVDLGYWDMTPNASPSSGWDYNMIVYPDLAKIDAANPTVNFKFLKLLKVPDTETPGPGFDWSSYVLTSGNYCDGLNIVDTPLLGRNFYHPYYSHEIYHGQTGAYLPVDSLVGTGFTSFSRGGMGGAGEGGAGLPIELLYLRADPVNNTYILVSWATATEINNAGFQVLRSTDAVNFEQIGWVQGNGNTSLQKNYSFADHDVEPNRIYYYMLKQIDYDGGSELTYVVSAMLTTTNVFIVSEFIPNPTRDNTFIEVVSSDAKKVNFKVYNTLGQIVQKFDQEILPGKNRVEQFDLDRLADGTYYAIITVDNEILNRKLVLTK